MAVVDLAFRVFGASLPVDHGYTLYSAINRIVPELHDAREIGVHPIRGRYAGDGFLHLTEFSRLILRLSHEGIPPFLKLAGKSLSIEDFRRDKRHSHRLRVGVPETRTLRPAPALYSHLTTIKGFLEDSTFVEGATRQLVALGITADIRLGERRTFRVRDKQVVGFAMTVAGLSPEASLRLQEVGIGGRRRMGCGIFLPKRA
jgi:CRISPR-associated protein Cas6